MVVKAKMWKELEKSDQLYKNDEVKVKYTVKKLTKEVEMALIISKLKKMSICYR